jgi:Novel STAND NTPase 1
MPSKPLFGAEPKTGRDGKAGTDRLLPGASNCYQEIPLDPMPASRFGELIEGQAERFGLRLRPGLGEHPFQDTQHDDALSLLAFALAQLYARSAARFGERARWGHHHVSRWLGLDQAEGEPAQGAFGTTTRSNWAG